MGKESFLERSDTEFIKAIEDEACFSRKLNDLSFSRGMSCLLSIGSLLWNYTNFKDTHDSSIFGFIVWFGMFIHKDMKIKMLKSLRKRNSAQGA